MWPSAASQQGVLKPQSEVLEEFLRKHFGFRSSDAIRAKPIGIPSLVHPIADDASQAALIDETDKAVRQGLATTVVLLVHARCGHDTKAALGRLKESHMAQLRLTLPTFDPLGMARKTRPATPSEFILISWNTICRPAEHQQLLGTVAAAVTSAVKGGLGSSPIQAWFSESPLAALLRRFTSSVQPCSPADLVRLSCGALSATEADLLEGSLHQDITPGLRRSTTAGIRWRCLQFFANCWQLRNNNERRRGGAEPPD
jgi:hypothetical protein